jgi:hypothetical protein
MDKSQSLIHIGLKIDLAELHQANIDRSDLLDSGWSEISKQVNHCQRQVLLTPERNPIPFLDNIFKQSQAAVPLMLLQFDLVLS